MPTRNDLRAALESSLGLRVSIYLGSPTEQGFAEWNAVPRRLRSMIDECVARMRALGVAEDEIESTRRRLGSVELSARDLGGREWTAVILHARDFLGTWSFPERLEDRCAVGRSFLLLPLLDGMRRMQPFRVLELSNERVAFWECEQGSCKRVEDPRVPTDLGDALGREIDSPADLQLHSTERGGGAAVFHGNSGDEREVDQVRFHHAVAHAAAEVWPTRRDPLVLAADQSHQGRFRKIARLPGLLDEGVGASHLSAETLEAARAVVRDHSRHEEHRTIEVIAQLPDERRRVHLEAASAAAEQGMVRRLLVERGRRRPGLIRSLSNEVDEPHGDEDALDELAATVARAGGEVLVVGERLPSDEGLVAELRGAV